MRNVLLQLMQNEVSAEMRILAAEYLGLCEPGNEKAIATLVDLIETSQDKFIQEKAVDGLRLIGDDNEVAIDALERLIQTAEDENIRRKAAFSLAKIDDDNPTALPFIVHLIKTGGENMSSRWFFLNQNWREIVKRNPKAIAAIEQLIQTTDDEEIRIQAAKNLVKIGAGNATALDAVLQIGEKPEDERTRKVVAETLGEIGKNSERAIDNLIQLAKTAEDEETRLSAAYSLGQIQPGNELSVNVLIQLIQNSKNRYIRQKAAEAYGKIAPNNEIAIDTLIELIQTAEDTYDAIAPTESLHYILQNASLPKVVIALKDYLTDEVGEDNVYFYEACEVVMWHCAENMNYPAFYQAWHSKPSTTHSDVSETSDNIINSLKHSLNLAYLPQSLTSALADDSHLSQNVKMICIDGSKFIDPDNPASKIYTEMVKGGCPRCDDGTPKTMPQLQAYWDLLTIDSDRTLVLILYHPQEFSDKFLDALSKFDGAICIVTSQPVGNCPLQQFSGNQPNLVDNIVGWIRARVYDALL